MECNSGFNEAYPEPHAQAYLWKSELLMKKLQEATQIFTPDRGEKEERFIYKTRS